MAGSLNRVQLLGTLGKDPEVRTTQNGNKIANLTVATSETWKDRQSGERKERTEWHRIVIFGDGLAGVAEQYLRKGSQAYFEGKLQTRKWTDQSGQDRYSTEVVISGGDDKLILVGGRPSGSSEERGARRVGRNGSAAPHEAGPQRDDSDLRDEIPF